MSSVLLLAAATNAVADAVAAAPRAVSASAGFGLVFWSLLLLSAVALAAIAERVLLYRREQIDSAQFLAGVRNVIKRDNVLEALSICDATPGPVARMVKAAILAREGGRERGDRGGGAGKKSFRRAEQTSRAGPVFGNIEVSLHRNGG